MFQLAVGLVGIAAAIVAWLRERGQLDQAKAELIASQLRGVLDEVNKANAARDAVRADVAARPDSVRDVDPNSRD